jgi:hypothetical protein
MSTFKKQKALNVKFLKSECLYVEGSGVHNRGSRVAPSAPGMARNNLQRIQEPEKIIAQEEKGREK